jgi:hypothetical protein
MPTYKITNPNTGKTIRVTGDAPPTQADAAAIFASIDPTPQVQPGKIVEGSYPEIPQLDAPVVEPAEKPESGFMDKAVGVAEAGLQALSSLPAAVTYIPATVASVAEAVVSDDFGTQQAAKRAEEKTMERAQSWNPVPIYEPTTPEGKKYSQVVGKVAESLPPILGAQGPLITSAALRAPLASGRNVVDEGLRVPLAKARNVVESVVPQSLQRMSARQMAALKRHVSGIDERVQVFESDGTITPEAMEVIARPAKAKSTDSTADGSVNEVIEETPYSAPIEGVGFTPDQLTLYNTFLRQGIQPTRANVTASTDDMRMQQDAIKRDSVVTEVVASQAQKIANRLDEQFDKATDPDANIVPEGYAIDGTDISTGSNIFRAADNFAQKSEDAINEAYKIARQNAQEGAVVDPSPLVTAVRATVGTDRANMGVPTAIQNELVQMGILKKNKNGDFEVARLITVEEAENIRKYINTFYKDKRDARPTMRSYKDALDSAVARATGEDIFVEARRLKTEYQQAIEKTKKNSRDKSRNNLVTDIIESKIDEDKIYKKIDNATISDFRNFKNFMLEFGGDEGRAALQSLKASYWKKMLDSIQLSGTKVGGVADISYPKLKNFVNKLKQNGKFNLLFDQAEQRLINDLLAITESRVMDTSVRSGGGPSGSAIEKVGDRIIQAGLNANLMPAPSNPISNIMNKRRSRAEDEKLLNLSNELASLVEGSSPGSAP